MNQVKDSSGMSIVRALQAPVCFFLLMMVAGEAAWSQDLMRLSRIIMAQRAVASPSAVYPEAAKTAGVEGTVVLDVVISKTGTVEQVQVLNGPDMLREAAKQAVKTWTYQPYTIDGAPVEVDTRAMVEFSLKNGGETRNASGDAVENMTDATVAATPSAPPAARTASPAGPVRVSNGVMGGMILHKEQPVYPYAAIVDKLSGTVIMHAIISKTGTIETLEVISGDDRLRAAALDAVRRWTYKPFLFNGQPTEVDTHITVNFQYGGHSSASHQPQTGPAPGTGGFGPH